MYLPPPDKMFAVRVSILERSMNRRGQEARVRAPATAALCIGGMVIARAMENRASADALRAACMKVALERAGKTERPARRRSRAPARSVRVSGRDSRARRQDPEPGIRHMKFGREIGSG